MRDGNSLGRARTCDTVVNSHLLYLLSYQGIGISIFQSVGFDVKRLASIKPSAVEF